MSSKSSESGFAEFVGGIFAIGVFAAVVGGAVAIGYHVFQFLT